MARHARRDAEMGLTAISIEGGLISPEQVMLIAATTPDQKAADAYGCPKGVSLRDEITRYFRIGQAHWQDYARIDVPNVIQTARFAHNLLKDTFGFDDLKGPVTHRSEGHTYRITLEARDGRVPVVVAAPLADPKAEAFTKTLPEMGDDEDGSVARRSPAGLLQSWLNAKPEFYWGLVFAGDRVRLMRDNASFTRAAHIEADLGAIFRDEMFADFTALWFLIHASRFGASGAGPADCALERWREAGQKSGTAARERLRVNVEEALLALGQGLIDGNPDLARLMAADGSVLTSVYEQLLRVVYRLIFLAVAEARDLLHAPSVSPAARALYAGSYGFSHLRERAARRAAHDHHSDAWEGVQIVFRALERGEKVLGLPGLGGLFAAGKTQELDGAVLSNRAFLTAVFRLSWLIEDDRRVRINWRDMATEELGSVYEGLLELVPQIVEHGRTFAFAGGDEARGNARKTSGSYYTPDSLVQALLDSALDPLLERAEAEGGAEAILALNIVDPACGSGHFLLGAARRMATRVAQLWDIDAPDYQAAMREVVRLCVHGVDRNPMAVELAKVALWIEAIDPGKPLGFLDANIRCGDSLLGVFDLKVLELGIPDSAYKPLAGDDPDAARVAAKVNRAQRDDRVQLDMVAGLAAGELARQAERLHAMAEDSLADVKTKAEAFARFRQGAGWGARKLACDLYVGAFLRKKQFRLAMGEGLVQAKNPDRVPTTLDVRTALAGRQPDGQLTAMAIDLAEDTRAFHWPLEFPDIFARGGFDLVLGNPPWDTMSPDAKEFFAVFDPAVRTMAPADQKRRIGELNSMNGLQQLWDDHCRHLYVSAQFFREGGRYKLFAEGNLGKGDFNVYRMFVELALFAAKPRGIAAQFVPENLYNGANAAAIRLHLFEHCELHVLAGFENTRKVWFDIDTRAKFCLYVASIGGATTVFPAAFGVNSEDKLAAVKGRWPFDIPVELVREFSPDAMAVAEVVHASDVTIGRKLYARFPKFGADVSGLSYRKYSREIDMGTDNDNFIDSPSGIPIYEGRMIEAFDHRAKAYVSGRGRAAVWRELPFGSPEKAIAPQWRLAESDLPEKLDRLWKTYRIGFCDVASPTNQRAFVAALIPPGVVCGHKVPTIEFEEAKPGLTLLLLAAMNSICVDFIARKKVALTMSYTVVDSLPLPRSYSATRLEQEIAKRALLLAATGSEMADYWSDVAPQFGLDPNVDAPVQEIGERRRVQAEIDVLVARDLYALSRDEMRFILDPADILGADCGFQTFGALKRAEEREFEGRFLTRDLILQKWDELPSNIANPGSHASPDEREGSAPGRVEFDPSALPDQAWALPAAAGIAETIPLQLAGLLAASPRASPESEVRLAALFALEPRLLTPHLSGERRHQWRRLVGTTAEPLSGSVLAFSPPVHTLWGQTVSQMRAAQALIHTETERTWSAGPGLSRYVIPTWADGRARFLQSVIAELNLSSILSTLPIEDQTWIRGHEAA